MKFARLENKIVMDVVEALYAENLDHLGKDLFILIPKELENVVVSGWTYKNGVWEEPATILPSKDELKRQSKIASQDYLSLFFSDKELIHMQIQFALGKAKAQAVYAWIQKGFELYMQYQAQVDFGKIPSNDYSSLGVPPYTYEGVITE